MGKHAAERGGVRLACRACEGKPILVGSPGFGQLHTPPKEVRQQEDGRQGDHATSKHLQPTLCCDVEANGVVFMGCFETSAGVNFLLHVEHGGCC